MKGVRFGTFHTYDEWGLILQSKSIEAPKIKAKQVEIEGSDGVIDLTEELGAVNYSNRSLSFQFAKKEITQEEYLTLYSVIHNAIHGQKLHIILDDDPNYFYVGRVSINDWKSDRNLGTIVIEVDAEPFKYDILSSLDEYEWDSINFETDVLNETKNLVVSGSFDVVITGRKKNICPEITSSAAMQVEISGKRYSIIQGKNKLYQFVVGEGDNHIKFIGTGTVSIDYRGCSL